MRRPLSVLVSTAMLLVLALSVTSCGSVKAQTSSASVPIRHLVSLNGFELRPGQTYRVTFAVDASTLRIIAFVRGKGPAPGADPGLRCQLDKVTATALTPVPLEARERTGETYWTYAAQTTSPLTAGIYRLTLTGDGRLQPFSAAQL